MYNKEKFHNTLALALGSEIVKDKRLNISIDDSSDDAPKMTISVVGTSVKIVYDASENCNDSLEKIEGIAQVKVIGVDQDLMKIIKSANAAYISSKKELVSF